MSRRQYMPNGCSARLMPRAARGFTLIEILVVVAIIALLISIMLPSLAAAREASRRTLCGTQTAQMSKALLMYNGEQRDYLPGPLHQALELETVGKNAVADYESFHLPYYIRRYFSDRSAAKKLTDRVVKCPTAEKITSTANIWAKDDAARPFTYTLNSWSRKMDSEYYETDPDQYFGWPGPGAGATQFWASGPDAKGRFSVNTNASPTARPKKISQIRQHGREWAIGDAFRYEKPLGLAGTSHRRAGDWMLGTYQNIKWLTSAGIPVPRYPYHDKGIVVVMFDGHTEYQRPWRGSVNFPR